MPRLGHALPIAFLLTLACACAPRQAQVLGIIMDGESGQPIPNARIVAHSDPSYAEHLARSTSEGRYGLSLEPGSHTVSVGAAGYVTETIASIIGPRVVAQIRDVSLSRRRLRGQVMDARSAVPVSSARLRHGGFMVQADGAGLWETMTPTDESIVVSADGYVSTTVSAAEIQVLRDADGRQTQALRVALEPRCTAGQVVDACTGEPLEGVMVASHKGSVETSGDGRYELCYVDSAAELVFVHPGYLPVGPLALSDGAHREVALKPRDPVAAVFGHEDVTAGTDAEAMGEAPGSSQASTEPGPGSRGQTEGDSGDASSRQSAEHGGSGPSVALGARTLAGSVTCADSGDPITTALVLAYDVVDPLAHQGLTIMAPITVTAVDRAGRFAFADGENVASLVVKAPGFRRDVRVFDGSGEETFALEPLAVRAVYVPFGLLTLPGRIAELLDMVEDTELNGVVVDVKGDWSRLAWDSPHPLAQETGAYQSDVMDPRDLVADCHERGIYAIARIVVFKDELLATHRPEWAVARAEGGLYVDLEDLHWVDPFRAEVQEYNITLIREAIALGFDEIQLDYLRFPSDGRTKGLAYSQEANFDTRTAAMAAFCAQVAEAVLATPAQVSADIFGLTVWVDPSRDMGIGQRVDDIAPYMDYVSPMLYPTTFGEGNLGFDVPGLYPYEVVYHSVLRTKRRTSTPVRPWLQHYSIGGIEYDLEKLLLQRRAAEDAGSDGWIFWNARGRYDPAVFAAGATDAVEPPALDEDS